MRYVIIIAGIFGLTYFLPATVLEWKPGLTSDVEVKIDAPVSQVYQAMVGSSNKGVLPEFHQFGLSLNHRNIVIDRDLNKSINYSIASSSDVKGSLVKLTFVPDGESTVVQIEMDLNGVEHSNLETLGPEEVSRTRLAATLEKSIEKFGSAVVKGESIERASKAFNGAIVTINLITNSEIQSDIQNQIDYM